MIKVFFIYITLNIFLIPLYMILIVSGGVSISLNPNSNFYWQILQTYLMAVTPNIVIFIAIHIWGEKYKLNRRWKVICLVIVSGLLLFFIAKDLLPAEGLKERIWD